MTDRRRVVDHPEPTPPSRQPLEITNQLQILTTMAEGNPGAMTVLRALFGQPAVVSNVIAIMDADDMNIRGSQLWVAYKDVCGMDVELLKQKLHDRDAEMVAVINRECPKCEPAVTGGASFERAKEK